MWEFNEIVKSLNLGVTRLMHMEGGPTASLSIRSRDINIDLAGGYETSTSMDDTNSELWPIPNVIGVQIR
jgi:hypothetical protein